MKKKLLPLLAALLLLAGCAPQGQSDPTPTPSETTPTPEVISVRDFFVSKMTEKQRALYDVLESGVITEDSPYLFDEPLLSSDDSLRDAADVLDLYNALHEVRQWQRGKYWLIISEDGTSYMGVKLEEAVVPAGSREEMAAAFEPVFEAWLAQLPGKDAPDAEKVRAICDLMCSELTYNYESLEGGWSREHYDRNRFAGSEYGALVYGTCVCEGYALTFQCFAEALGLDSMVVTGDTAGAHHAWNLVRVDGQWYHVDVTWMDSGDPERPDESWLLRSDEEFSTTRWSVNVVGDGHDHNALFLPPEAPENWWAQN